MHDCSFWKGGVGKKYFVVIHSKFDEGTKEKML